MADDRRSMPLERETWSLFALAVLLTCDVVLVALLVGGSPPLH